MPTNPPQTIHTIQTPTIFLPGTMCDERIFMPLWKHVNLAHKSYVPLQWAQTLSDMLALTQDRIDSVQGKVNLVGFSLGGYIAALSALQKDNLNKIANLVLVGYDPFGLSEQENTARQQMLKLPDSKKASLKMSKQRLSQYFTQEELNQAPLIQPVIDMHNDLGPATLLAQIQSSTPRKNIAKELAKLNAKQVLVGAEADKIAQVSNLKKYINMCDTAFFAELKNTAHMAVLSKPQEIANILSKYL